MLEALLAGSAAPESTADLGFFGGLIGSWRLRWQRIGPAGETVAEADGELHVGWVLGGRAVQDVWIVPGPNQPGYGVPPDAFHGTTLRFFDTSLGAWRSTWIEPLNNRVRKFLGRPTADGLELLSDDDVPMLRWRFTEVTADAFTWLGERREGTCDPWQLEEVMAATRVFEASAA